MFIFVHISFFTTTAIIFFVLYDLKKGQRDLYKKDHFMLRKVVGNSVDNEFDLKKMNDKIDELSHLFAHLEERISIIEKK